MSDETETDTTEVTIPYVTGPEYRSHFVDGTLVAIYDNGTNFPRIQVNFTRLELSPTVETMTVTQKGRDIHQSETTLPGSMLSKIVESTVTMRPDVAMKLVKSIMDSLQGISPEVLNLYDVNLKNDE